MENGVFPSNLLQDPGWVFLRSGVVLQEEFTLRPSEGCPSCYLQQLGKSPSSCQHDRVMQRGSVKRLCRLSTGQGKSAQRPSALLEVISDSSPAPTMQGKLLLCLRAPRMYTFEQKATWRKVAFQSPQNGAQNPWQHLIQATWLQWAGFPQSGMAPSSPLDAPT